MDHGEVHAGAGTSEGPLGHAPGRVERRPALALAVPLDQDAAEPPGEPLPVAQGGLGAEGAAQRVVGVVGPLGGGQDVGDGLAHVAEGGGAVAADVVEEGRGAEARAQGHGGPHLDRRPPQGHEGVAVEERHRAVADAVRRVAVAGAGHLGDLGEPSLGAAHGLGRARGARGEEEEVQLLRGDRPGPLHQALGRPPGGRGGVLEAGQAVPVLLGAHHQDPLGPHPEVEPAQQMGALIVGHHELAVGGPHVGGQRLAPAGGVDAHHGRPGQGGAVEPEEVLGHVGQEHAHVERSRAAERGGQRRPARPRRPPPRARSTCRWRRGPLAGRRPPGRPGGGRRWSRRRSRPRLPSRPRSGSRSHQGPVEPVHVRGAAERHHPAELGLEPPSSAATPSPPPVARAHRAGRPTSTARAPRASALATSAARRIPPST